MIRDLARVALALVLTASAAVPSEPERVPPPRPGSHPIVVAARPIEAFRPSEASRRRFGRLDFLGGLVLSSSDNAFGGLSGLRTFDHGRDLLAISDEGHWFAARLVLDDAGRPSRVVDAETAPILDENGRSFRTKTERDAESLTVRPVDGGIEARIGFEGRHRVAAHRAARWRDLTTSPGRRIAVPAEIARLPLNEGLEALADAPSGALVAIAEAPEPGATASPGWILGGPSPGRFRFATTDGFAVTDAAYLPDGDLLVLQRRFRLLGGLAARLVRVAAADLRPGATVSGEIMLDCDGGDEIDNMEGLAVDTDADGATILTLVSDDNFLWLQRTVLLRFRLVDEASESPRG